MTEPRRIPLDEQGMPVRKEDVPDETPTDCDCPRLAAEDWDAVENDWSDIAFVKTSTSAVLGVPVGFDSSREELRKKAAKAGASVPEHAMLLIGSGKFRRPILLEVEDAPDGGKDVERPGGFAYTRLVPAPWGELPKIVERTRREASERYGREPDDLWVWYLTCRLCSKARNFETLIVAHYRAAL